MHIVDSNLGSNIVNFIGRFDDSNVFIKITNKENRKVYVNTVSNVTLSGISTINITYNFKKKTRYLIEICKTNETTLIYRGLIYAE